MITLNSQSPSLPPNRRRLIAFTTPENYAGRLSRLIHLKGWDPLWCPTVTVGSTSQTISSVEQYLLPPCPPLRRFSALAFTSRTGIAAFAQALAGISAPPLTSGEGIFTISALGKDAELLDESFIARLSGNPSKIRVLVPTVATPAGMVEALGSGRGRKVLCPVPLVTGLEEPPVVPAFLAGLGSRGWVPVRVDAYETRWRGDGCAAELLAVIGAVDAVVFTSTAEVEGLLKGLEAVGLSWANVRRMSPRMVAATHGPVTAAGSERLGVGIDVVSSRFDSFEGVVDAVDRRFNVLII